MGHGRVFLRQHHELFHVKSSQKKQNSRSVVVAVGSSQEEVPLDPVRGPLVMQLDGTTTHLQTVRGITGGGQAVFCKGESSRGSLSIDAKKT